MAFTAGGLLTIGSIGWYFREIIWGILKWFMMTSVFKLGANFMFAYLFGILQAGVAVVLNTCFEFDNRIGIFEACVFASRSKLKEAGFFDVNNAQKGPFFFPRTADSTIEIANRSYRKLLSIAIGNILVWMIGTIIYLLPIDEYCYKSLLYFPHGLFYLLINSEYFNITKHDLINIIVEVPDEQIPEEEGGIMHPVDPNQPIPAHPAGHIPEEDPVAGNQVPAQVARRGRGRRDPRLRSLEREPAAADNQERQQRRLEQAARRPMGRQGAGLKYPVDNSNKNRRLSDSYRGSFILVSLAWAFLGPKVGAVLYRCVRWLFI